MNFNHSNAADFDAPPGTEIVLHNINEGLDDNDVNELPFGNDFEDQAPIHRGTSFFGRNRNKLIITGMTAAVVLFVSGTSIAVSRNNRIASNFATATVDACKSSKLQAPKQSKSPKQSKALKKSKAPKQSGTPAPGTPPPTTSMVPSLEPSGVCLSVCDLNSFFQSQLYALSVLYYATNGDSWGDNSGWLDFSQSECGWYGVTCNDENIVTFLDLSANSLSGSIPTEIGLLKSLENLYLEFNQLAGAIPSEVCALRNDVVPPGPLAFLVADCSVCNLDPAANCCTACE
eukprot:scaffold5610_cov83-Skeletonema_menzelii.AAC.2